MNKLKVAMDRVAKLQHELNNFEKKYLEKLERIQQQREIIALVVDDMSNFPERDEQHYARLAGIKPRDYISSELKDIALEYWA